MRVVDVLGHSPGHCVVEGSRVEGLEGNKVAEDEARARISEVQECLDLPAQAVKHGLAELPPQYDQTQEEL